MNWERGSYTPSFLDIEAVIMQAVNVNAGQKRVKQEVFGTISVLRHNGCGLRGCLVICLPLIGSRLVKRPAHLEISLPEMRQFTHSSRLFGSWESLIEHTMKIPIRPSSKVISIVWASLLTDESENGLVQKRE